MEVHDKIWYVYLKSYLNSSIDDIDYSFLEHNNTFIDILFCFSDYESDYSHIYGRLPLPYGRFRQYPSPSHPSSRQMYVSEWE